MHSMSIHIAIGAVRLSAAKQTEYCGVLALFPIACTCRVVYVGLTLSVVGLHVPECIQRHVFYAVFCRGARSICDPLCGLGQRERERERERQREREREKEGLILCSAESNMGKEMNTSIKVESLGLPVSP